MKKIISAALIFVIAAICFPASAVIFETNTEEYFKTIYDYKGNYYFKTAESFYGGSGTENDPYLISSWEEFNLLNEYGCGDKGKNVYFKLTQDLSYTGINVVINKKINEKAVYTVAVGSEEEPFEGVFDGAGYTLNAYINGKGGVFAVIGSEGKVKNIKCNAIVAGDTSGAIANINNGLIENCKVTFSMGGAYHTTNNVGGIAGENTGTITKCTAVRKTDGCDIYSEGTGIGGICGYNNGGTISECYSKIYIRGSSTSRAIGGIAGDNTGGIIINCSSTSTLENAGSETGGICGRLYDGTIENCLALARINGALDKSGSLVGAVYGDNEIKSCYSFMGRSTKYYPAIITIGNATAETAEYGNSLEELENIDLYEGWDFENVWVISADGYPIPRSYYKFSDCITHWAYDAVTYLTDKGKISGYEDGTFRPDNTVTKAEFIKMAVSVTFSDDYSSEYPYKDIPGWAANYVSEAYADGLLENIALSDTELGADKPITRAEAAAIIGRMESGDSAELTFADTPEIPDWAAEPIGRAFEKGYISGYEDNTFRPYGTLTRAEAAQIIYNYMN